MQQADHFIDLLKLLVRSPSVMLRRRDANAEFHPATKERLAHLCEARGNC